MVRVGSGRSYSMSRLSYTLTAPAQLRRLRWDVFVHEFSAFAPLRIPRRLRRQGVLFFQHFMGKHALHKHGTFTESALTGANVPIGMNLRMAKQWHSVRYPSASL